MRTVWRQKPAFAFYVHVYGVRMGVKSCIPTNCLFLSVV